MWLSGCFVDRASACDAQRLSSGRGPSGTSTLQRMVGRHGRPDIFSDADLVRATISEFT